MMRSNVTSKVTSRQLSGRKEEQVTSYNTREQQGIFEQAPLLEHKYYNVPSLFTPENLLREARRQKGLAVGQVPAICVLDPDGDLVDHLAATDRTHRHSSWACYHTVLDTFVHEEIEYGIIGRV